MSFSDFLAPTALVTVLASAIPACGDGPADPGSGGPLMAEQFQRNYELTNGMWFSGESFAARTMYSVAGRLTDERPSSVDSVINLQGGYVVPAYGEAHQHNIEGSAALDGFVQDYLARGVFYVRNPNVLPRTRPAATRINVPGSVDAIFSNGGFTSPGGHPAGVAQRNIDRGAWSVADGSGAFYWEVTDEASLRVAFSEFVGADPAPEFVKVYLLYSEEYDRRIGDDRFVFWRGMDPDLLPVLVELAHAEGLSIYAHVESAHDFRVAVEAGVDQVGHMPGFRKGQGPDPLESGDEAFLIDPASARLAASRGIPVVTTLGNDARGRVGRTNLRTLHDAGVTILVGTDSYEADPSNEIRDLESSGVFSNLELLRMWSVETPRSIFPGRDIGSVDPGAEANFLVLEGNPIEDFDALFGITLRVKSGRLLRPE